MVGRELKQSQEEDKGCQSLTKGLRDRKNTNTILLKVRKIRGIMFVLRTINRGVFKDEYLVPIIPDALMPAAFKLIHEDTTAGHKGFDRTLRKFQTNFYHPQENARIKQLCEKCESCLKAKANPQETALLKYPIPGRPFETVSNDLVGPYRTTIHGNKYATLGCLRL